MNWLAREAHAFLAAQRDALLLWKYAPAIPLIVILAEFVQHAVEIRMGMFASLDAFRSLQMDAARMAFGGIKLAMMLIAVLLAARFWTNRHSGARWWSFAGIGWKQVLLGVGIQGAASLPGLFDVPLPPPAELGLGVALTVASLPGLVLIIGGILGDYETGLAKVYGQGWGQGLRMAVYAAPGWAVLSVMHDWHHMMAMGRPASMVWPLMAWDALVVGLTASLAGTALHHGYMAGRQSEARAA